MLNQDLTEETGIGRLSSDEKRERLKQKLRAKLGEFQSLYPLSIGQQSLWILHEIAPDSAAYNIMCAARLDPGVDVTRLRRAFQAVTDRHPSLRTTYRALQGRPYQVVHDRVEAPFEVVDASTWDEAELNRGIFERADSPFDLERGVMRASLFTQADGTYVLLLVVHHIAIDFWSLELIVQELSAFYAAYGSGGRPLPPPIPATYADFVRRQKAMLEGPEGERLWEYWRTLLAGELPVLNLATDRPRPRIQTYAGASHRIELDAGLCKKIRRVASSQGVTLFTAVLGAFKVLLHRYSHQDDIIVATPGIGRDHHEYESVVGYFSNPIMLRSCITAGLHFDTFLGQLRQTVISALEHQDLPFLTLVERLGIKQEPGRSPVFQAMLMWDKERRAADPHDTDGLKLEPFAFGQRGAPFDLTLTVVERETNLTALFAYNVALFDAGTIERLANHFRVLLETIVADPSQEIGQLELLTPEEKQRILIDWNDTARDYSHAHCVHHQIARQAGQTPDAVAVVCGNRQLSYAQLNHRANRLAQRLRSMGVDRNVPVAVMLERSLDLPVSLLGVLMAGGAYVPIDPGYPQERIDQMLADSSPRVLLTQRKLVSELTERGGARILCLDTEWESQEKDGHAQPAPRTQPDDLAYVIYTSGSTGGPKGVQVTHGALVNFLVAMQAHFTVDDVLLAVTTVSFDIAALELFGPLVAGARCVIAEPQVAADGTLLAESLERCGATMMQATPATWRLLLRTNWNGGVRFKALCGGEALPQAVANQLLDRCGSLWNLYGPTETTIWSTAYKVDAGDRSSVPIGKPIANTRIYILDAMQRPVPVGVAGELYIGGEGVSPGYRNQPELTQAKFVPNPFATLLQERLYRTGDLARYLADGNIEYLGRLDHQVKVSGYRIELAEIEAQLARHPGVREAAVAAHEDESGEKRLVAYIVGTGAPPTDEETLHADKKTHTLPNGIFVAQQDGFQTTAIYKKVFEYVYTLYAARRPSTGRGERRATCQAASSPSHRADNPGLTVNELRHFLQCRLPAFMLPVNYVFLESLPVTPNGKLDRKALPAPGTARPALAEEYVAPRDDLERRLVKVWAQTLKLERVGVNDNFFVLGAASMQCVEVTSRLKEMGVNVVPELLFEHQTVAELAIALAARGPATPPVHRAEEQDTAVVGGGRTTRAVDPVVSGNLIIESLAVYLPEKSLSTKEVLEGCRKRVLFPLEKMTGIKSRRIAGESEFSIDLAHKAIADCLGKSKYLPEHIDLLICCNVSRYDGPDRLSFEPSTATKLRDSFGFTNALVFDINNACAGMFTAIMITDALMKTGAIRCGMVASGEYISHLTTTAQKEIDGFMDPRLACLTVGDAGAAIILERSPHPGLGFQEIDMYTLGKYSSLCIAKVTEEAHGGAIMHTDSIMQTTVAVKNAVMHGKDMMERCGWSPESFGHLIMHQTSETALRDVARALNDAYGKAVCHNGNTVYNIAERGNTATTTHIVALHDMICRGDLQSMERAIFGISGSGQTVGTALYTFDDLPDRLRRIDRDGRPDKMPSRDRTRQRRVQPSTRVRIAGLGTLPGEHGLGRDAVKLGRAAAERCLRDASYQPSDMDLLIYAGVYRNDFLAEPAVAALLAGELQVNDDIASIKQKRSFAFDVFNGAVGFLNGCYLASRLIEAQRFGTVLVVASEIENNAAMPSRGLRGLSETGAALILDAAGDGKAGFGNFVFRYQTDHINALSAYTARAEGRTFLRVDMAADIQSYYLEGAPAAISELLEIEGLNASQISIVFGPQISREFSTALSKRLGIPREKFVDVERDGNDLFTCALPYALQHARDGNRPEPGDIGLIICVGAGIQVGCAVYYF